MIIASSCPRHRRVSSVRVWQGRFLLDGAGVVVAVCSHRRFHRCLLVVDQLLPLAKLRSSERLEQASCSCCEVLGTAKMAAGWAALWMVLRADGDRSAAPWVLGQ